MSKITDEEYKVPFGTRGRKYDSKESAYAAHKKRVTQWQKDNPVTHKKATDKYYKTESAAQKRYNKYHNMPADEKEALLAHMRERNKRNYWAKKAKDKDTE